MGAWLQADTLILASGARVAGSVVSVSQATVTFKDATGATKRYRRDEVLAIEFSAPGSRKPTAAVLAIAAGTPFTLRLLEAIDTAVASPGQTYVAVFDEGVGDANQVVIPRGATAQLVVREAGVPGPPGRPPQAAFEIDAVTVHGRRFRTTAPQSAAPASEGTPVRPRLASGFSSRSGAAGPPVIRLAGPSLRLPIPLDGTVPGVDLLPGHHLRVAAGTRFTFTTAATVALQSAR